MRVHFLTTEEQELIHRRTQKKKGSKLLKSSEPFYIR